MPYPVPLGWQQKFQNSAWGVQDRLIIATVPSGASDGLRGQPLEGQTLTVDGAYKCLIPITGVVDTLEVHLAATFGAGTVTSSGPDTLFYVDDATTDASWVVKTAGTGDGALTSTVRQSASVTGMLGEQYALVTISIAGTSVVFSQAEYNGV